MEIFQCKKVQKVSLHHMILPILLVLKHCVYFHFSHGELWIFITSTSLSHWGVNKLTLTKVQYFSLPNFLLNFHTFALPIVWIFGGQFLIICFFLGGLDLKPKLLTTKQWTHPLFFSPLIDEYHMKDHGLEFWIYHVQIDLHWRIGDKVMFILLLVKDQCLVPVILMT